MKDSAVMVFVPSGTFRSGLTAKQVRQLARLKLQLWGEPSSVEEAEARAKERLIEILSEAKTEGDKGTAKEELKELALEQLIVRMVLLGLQEKDTAIPEPELHRWRSDGESLQGLLDIPVVREALGEAMCRSLLDPKTLLDPIEQEVKSMPADFLSPSEEPVGVFYIDKYEVTNRQYRLFMKAVGDKKHLPGISYPGRPGGIDYFWDHAERSADEQPVACVSVKDALAYAEWAGKSLPSRLQWERAAVGDGQRIFPWGSDFKPSYCRCSVVDLAKEIAENAPREGQQLSWVDLFKSLTKAEEPSVPAPVGKFAKDCSPFGCYDLAGNVSEWVYDGSEARHVQVGGNAETNILAWLAPASMHSYVEPRVGGFRTVLALSNTNQARSPGVLDRRFPTIDRDQRDQLPQRSSKPPTVAEREAQPPWRIIHDKEFSIAVPQGWRPFEDAPAKIRLYLIGDGMGVPLMDETGQPVQTGLAIERYPNEKSSAQQGAENNIAFLRANQRFTLVNEPAIESVRLADGTEAALFTVEFIKDKSRHSHYTKLFSVDTHSNGWVVVGWVVGGKGASMAEWKKEHLKRLRAHVSSFCFDKAKFGEASVSSFYLSQDQDNKEQEGDSE